MGGGGIAVGTEMRAAANKLGGKAVKVGALGERRLSGAKLTQRQMEGGWVGRGGALERRRAPSWIIRRRPSTTVFRQMFKMLRSCGVILAT